MKPFLTGDNLAWSEIEFCRTEGLWRMSLESVDLSLLETGCLLRMPLECDDLLLLVRILLSLDLQLSLGYRDSLYLD